MGRVGGGLSRAQGGCTPSVRRCQGQGLWPEGQRLGPERVYRVTAAARATSAGCRRPAALCAGPEEAVPACRGWGGPSLHASGLLAEGSGLPREVRIFQRASFSCRGPEEHGARWACRRRKGRLDEPDVQHPAPPQAPRRAPWSRTPAGGRGPRAGVGSAPRPQQAPPRAAGPCGRSRKLGGLARRPGPTDASGEPAQESGGGHTLGSPSRGNHPRTHSEASPEEPPGDPPGGKPGAGGPGAVRGAALRGAMWPEYGWCGRDPAGTQQGDAARRTLTAVGRALGSKRGAPSNVGIQPTSLVYGWWRKRRRVLGSRSGLGEEWRVLAWTGVGISPFTPKAGPHTLRPAEWTA